MKKLCYLSPFGLSGRARIESQTRYVVSRPGPSSTVVVVGIHQVSAENEKSYIPKLFFSSAASGSFVSLHVLLAFVARKLPSSSFFLLISLRARTDSYC